MKTGIKGYPVIQNGQEFIIGKAKISELLTYTMYTERLIIGYDDEEKPIYNDKVQRKVDDSRANRIADFLINDNTATFPTNIVLGIPMNIIEEQKVEDGTISILFRDCVAEEIKKAKSGDKNANVYITIIDGQHRIRGIELAIERLQKSSGTDMSSNNESRLTDLLDMELVISCFIDKSLEYQAMIFSTINRTQKRVSQDLVYSLFGLSDNDTPYKSALEIVLALNGHPKSPFYKRTRLYGAEFDKNMIPPLSQSTMIKKIVSFISETLRESEIDRYRKRKELFNKNTKKFLPFRNYYATDKDSMISDCMFYYFNEIRNQYPDLWNYDCKKKPENVLQSTIGFNVLMDILSDILERNDIASFDKNTFGDYVSRFSDLNLSDTTKFPMTTKGKKILYNSIFIKVFPDDSKNQEKINEINVYGQVSDAQQE